MEKPSVRRVALVTGSGSGIGRASALAFARDGSRVVVADVDAVEGERTVELIREGGGEAVFIRADVSCPDDVSALVDAAIAAYGRLDYAHNNAGARHAAAMTPTADCSLEEWERILTVNLTGTWLCMKYEIAAMLRQGSGSIVNTASIHGLVGVRGNPAYVASKHGIVGLTRSAALEYARAGIRINAVCPSWTLTPTIEARLAAQPPVEAQIRAQVPLGRLASPSEVAAAVLWLSSDAASFITGVALPIDGGWVAQ